ncbi:hypothetical protein DB30_08125 [Enhygromyxa salina]|uniref:Uncharacterized protein n=1 Tax=Enhygromyxa salina TaxID=215803 RepID=A0A0C1ZQV8_9BACT|nr:hypothetical protein [Enhygromyxa salina]KIG13358.1 hypothetical protein DB30_08125 [Enhygromyxa salina]
MIEIAEANGQANGQANGRGGVQQAAALQKVEPRAAPFLEARYGSKK